MYSLNSYKFYKILVLFLFIIFSTFIGNYICKSHICLASASTYVSNFSNTINDTQQTNNIETSIKDFISNYKTATLQVKELIHKKLQKKIKDNPTDFESICLLGFAYFLDEKYKLAIKCLKQVYTIYPKSIEIAHTLAKCYIHLSKPEQAYPLYKDILKLDPNNIDALYYISIYEIEANNIENALNLLQRLVSIYPFHKEALLALAKLLIIQNNPNDAILYLQKLIKLNKSFAEAYWLLGKSFQMLNKPEQSVIYYKQAKDLKYIPQSSQDEYNYAKALKEIGKYEDAIEEYKTVTKKSKDKFTGYIEIAEIYEKLGNLDAAIKYYQLAYNYNPNKYEILLKIANLYKTQNKLQEAENILSIIKKKKSTKFDTISMLEEINEETKHNHINHLWEIVQFGSDKQKIKALSEIIELDKSNKDAYYKVIEILKKFDDTKGLKHYYKLMYKNKIISEAEFNSYIAELREYSNSKKVKPPKTKKQHSKPLK